MDEFLPVVCERCGHQGPPVYDKPAFLSLEWMLDPSAFWICSACGWAIEEAERGLQHAA